MNWGPFYEKKNHEKKSHNSEKKLKGGTLWDFSTSILSQIIKKLKGGPFGDFFFEKKSHNAEKKFERGDPLVSPGNKCYAEKKKNLFGLVPWANR